MRFVALIVDLLIVATIIFFAAYIFNFSEVTGWIAFVILLVARDSIFQGGSLGKKLCGLIIIDFNSLKPLSRMLCLQRQGLFYGVMMTLIFAGYVMSKKHGYQYGLYPFAALLFLPLFEQIKGGRTISDKRSNALLVRFKDWKLVKSS